MKEIHFEIKIPKIRLSGQWKDNLKIILSLLVIVGVFIAKQNYEFSVFGTLILAYFGLSLIWKLDNRVAAGFAFLFLISCPILIILKNDTLAEAFAIYAYYFLVVTVIQEIFELKRRKMPKSATIVSPVDNFARPSKRKVV